MSASGLENRSSSVRSTIDPTFSSADSLIARRYVVTGYLVALAFLGSIFAWAAFVPISSAAIAPGIVGKDGYRQTVQHLEGGIIYRILVKDGDPVTEGQVLIELADVQSRADYDLLQKQKIIATARESGLLAAQIGSDDVRLPDWLNLDTVDSTVRDAINGQLDARKVANRLHKEQLDIIGRQISRARQKIIALKEEQVALQRRALLTREELDEYLSLQERGLVTRKAVFDLKREVSENETAYSSNKVAVQSTEQEINDLEMQRSTLVASHLSEISSELDIVREQLVNLDEKLSKTEDKLERTVILAPTSGAVVNMQVNTRGGVIRPGQPLLDIVPSEGNLIIDARIDPMDRDSVSIGQAAEIRFTAFNRRVTEPVAGRVTLISADSLTDTVTNEVYFQAKIELLENPEEVLNGGAVFPGMQAEVFIVTGSRTALSYLVAPISKSFNRAFKQS